MVTRKHVAFSLPFRSSISSLRNKAVADGAVAFYLDHVVSVRVARFTYGTKCSVLYNPLDPQHVARSATMYTHPSGLQYVPKAFDGILVKVCVDILN
jgi:hypothetical protein